MKIGWIGTGIMGLSMSGHIQANGHELFVFNRTKNSAEPLLAKGACWCDSPADVAARSEVLFTIVGLPEDVEDIYFGENGIFSVEGDCRIVVDMTTSRPSLAKMISRKAEDKGIDSLDAPVSGGDVGAKAGTLAIMVGGRRNIFHKVLPLFQLMGQDISFMGGPGAGQNTKMCNQILVAGTMIGVCESLLYASKLGLDQDAVIRIIGKGAAGSWSINNLGPRIVKGDYEPGFIVNHFIKDMRIALEEATEVGLSLPGLGLVCQLYLAVKAQGHGCSGTQALFIALESLNGGRL
ncbi:MAG: NAD(P)-dependent oxidoreductase [Deltaproteobacteria bacterium]|nr:NAD(P)-dependent oxidoreductase [Deltaproteobacteria bacterium]